MKEIIIAVACLILGFVFGFGIWYLIFWFITNDPNLFAWHWAVKIIYLFISFSSTSASIKALFEI
jgi:multisubunit Na+/H+ antiporter MnhE subunit